MKKLLLLCLLCLFAACGGGSSGGSGNGDMVFVEGGTFTMGSPVNEVDRYSDETEHDVTLSSFYMSRNEITQKEWSEIMGFNPSYSTGEDLPVEQVSWYDAVEYCNARSIKEGLTPAYMIDKTTDDPNNTDNGDALKWTVTLVADANGYRLPTESEWEYAARGGKEGSLDYYIYSGSDDVNAVGWYDGNNNTTHSVGGKQANVLGLYDMSGNVYEWVWDWYDDYNTTQTDPTGAVSGAYRVLRGGSWNNYAQDLRSAFRYYYHPRSRSVGVGFRVVRH